MTDRLDRPLDDLIKEGHRGRGSGGNRKRTHGRLNSVRAAPYQVQRRSSANAVPTAPRGDASNPWKHDLFKSVNVPGNNAVGGNKGKEEIIQFPPKRISIDQEKANLLQGNPLFQRLDAPTSKGNNLFSTPTSFSPPTGPSKPSTRNAPAPLLKSHSTPNLLTSSTPAISIAGTASSSVIISNLAPTVSVEDLKATLSGIGGGVREVHIISRSGKSGEGLQAKVIFHKPAEGGKACISKFDGIEADGRKISVKFDYPEKQDQSPSFLNRRPAVTGNVAPENPNPNRGGGRHQKSAQQSNVPVPAAAPAPTYPGVIDGTQGFVPQLYSDVMLIRSGQTKR